MKLRRFLLVAFVLAPPAAAQEAAAASSLDAVWVVVCAGLVFFMQAGFALLETGLTRAKNAANIIMKNVMDASAGGVVFFLVGFGLMFGPSLGGLVGTSGFGLAGLDGHSPEATYLFFFFQAVFAATAATIVSGAVAERVNFAAYLGVSAVLCGVIYPVFGGWAWGSLFAGGGWLEGAGFHDFAGSTVVHSVGGWAALAGALVMGPRAGKYGADGAPRAMPGHSPAAGGARRVHPVVRLVRLQRRLDGGGDARGRPDRRQHVPGGGGRRHRGDDADVDARRQARRGDDA